MLQQRVNRGLSTPAYDTRPHLYDDLMPVWSAFWELTRSRSIGMQSGPIPLSEIVSYLDFMMVRDLEDRHDLLYLIRQMDEEWLAYAEEERAQKPTPPKG